MQNKERVIKTNTSGKKANEILSAVIGQMSDGMFENSRYYEGYWMFCDIDDGNNICVDDSSCDYSFNRWYENKFYNMSDKEIKLFFAKMIKRIIQQEMRDKEISVRGQFKLGNTQFKTEYLNYIEEITVDDCVKVYNALVG